MDHDFLVGLADRMADLNAEAHLGGGDPGLSVPVDFGTALLIGDRVTGGPDDDSLPVIAVLTVWDRTGGVTCERDAFACPANLDLIERYTRAYIENYNLTLRELAKLMEAPTG